MDKNKKEKKRKEDKRGLGLFSRIGISEDRSYFIENLSMLLASGMSILSAIDAIAQEIKTGPMKKVVSGLKEDIESGMSLSKALERTKIFSGYILALIRIGEQSGRLPENLKVVNQRQQKEAAFRSKVKAAAMYPVFVLSFTLLIGLAIAWFILPRLASVFSSMRAELPWATKAIIGSGNFLNENGIAVIPAIIVVVFGLTWLIFGFKKTKFIGEGFLFNLPVIKKFILEVQLARFGYILGTLLDAGLPINEAIASLDASVKFKAYNKFYKYLGGSISEGHSFQQSFSEYKGMKKIIPVPIQQMIIAGEQSGSLPQTLLKIGETFEEKMDNTTKNLTVFIEPILLILVGLGVAFIAIGVILPIYSLMGNLNNQASNPVSSSQTNTQQPIVVSQDEDEGLIDMAEQQVMEDVELTYIKIVSQDEFVSIYNEANIESVVFGQVKAGDSFEFITEQDDWYQIAMPDGEVAWILKDYAKIEQ
ncbi:hypothetical protein C0580_03530 [Candidatus Parcubacteria bacterium]|nr:MAG: hypothetical protein C0580_03530 [Candidatus Parcubacteria bacterium]